MLDVYLSQVGKCIHPKLLRKFLNQVLFLRTFHLNIRQRGLLQKTWDLTTSTGTSKIKNLTHPYKLFLVYYSSKLKYSHRVIALIQEGLTLFLRINAYICGNSSTADSLVKESTVTLIKQSGQIVEYKQFS